MHFVRQATILSLLLSVCSYAFSDSLKSPIEARQLTEIVMAKVSLGEVEDGMKLVKPYSVVSPAEFEVMLDQMKIQLPSLAQRYGKSIGYEFISQDNVGENLIRIIYIQRFEKYAMRWGFIFYHGKDGWLSTTLKADDDVHKLFPTAG